MPAVAVVVAVVGAFLAFMDSTIVNVAFPDLQSSFPHTSIGELSWVLNAYNVVFAGLLVVSGRLADLFGRKRVFLTGIGVFLVASGLCALAPSVPVLVVFRLVQGVGAALLVPASLGVVLQAAPASGRSAAIGIWGAASALAAGLGPPIGGALVDAYDWRLVFLVNVPLGIVAWVLVRRKVLESRSPDRRRAPDWLGAFALSVALGTLTLGIVQGPTWGWGSVGVVACFVVAPVAAAVTVVSSLRHPSPVLDPKLLSIRAFGVSTAVAVLLGLGLYTYLLAHILWLHYVWGYSLLLAGAAVAPGALVAAVTARPFGRLADRYGTRAVAVPGALVWASAYLWYVTEVGVHPDFLGQWLPGQVLSGIGVGATLPVMQSGGLLTVPARRYATASSVATTARQVGGVIGIAVLTVLVAHPTAATIAGELRHGWELAGWSFFAAAVVGLFFGRARQGVEVERSVREARVELGSLVGAAGARGGADRLPVAGSDPGPVETDGDGRVRGGGGFLEGLTREELDSLLGVAAEQELAAGEVLFSAGDRGDAMYILRAGRLVLRFPDGSTGEVGAGSAVGELAVLSGTPRAATVVARRASLLWRIDEASFERCMQVPGLALSVARNVGVHLERSRPVPDRRPTTPKVVAVVGASPAAPVGAVGAVLVRAVADLLGVDRVAGLCDPGAADLARAEAANDVVVLTAADGTDPAGVLRQADRVVVVSDRVDPGPGLPVEVGAGRPSGVPLDVVLVTRAPTDDETASLHTRFACRRVYPAGTDPSGWPGALLPLAARLARRSLAVVLGGGGARGLAHLGVLAALEEAGVRVDRLAGTSSGAIVAAAYALLGDSGVTDEMVFEEMVVAEPLKGWRPSRRGLSGGDRIWRGLHRAFGDRRLEALSRELVVVSTDLYRREAVYHRSGLVREAVGASLALPLLWPPRVVDGRVLVDGGLRDNVPTAAFADLDEGPILAVRVAPPPSDHVPRRPPGLGELAFRLIALGDQDSAAAGNPEPTVTVTADTRGVGFLEFHQIDTARDAGRRAGEAAVAALRQVAGDWITRP